VVAAQFTFVGHTYLAIVGSAGSNTFNDVTDLLLDISGATGTMAGGQFHLRWGSDDIMAQTPQDQRPRRSYGPTMRECRRVGAVPFLIFDTRIHGSRLCALLAQRANSAWPG
jgi:hypothetical protein